MGRMDYWTVVFMVFYVVLLVYMVVTVVGF